MALLSLNDVAFDASSTVTFYFGTQKVNPVEVTTPDQETKAEKVARIGEPQASKQTLGRTEIGNLKVSFELADYTSKILPYAPVHGGGLVYFPATVKFGHPSINGSLGVYMERCRILKHAGVKLSPDEKAIVKELEISVMRMWEKGADGKLKSHAALSGELPPTLAINLTLSF